MDVKRSIDKAIHETFPTQEVYKIVDYREKGVYVAYIKPKGAPLNKNYFDNAIMVDNKTFKVKKVLNPIIDDVKDYQAIMDKRVIYDEEQ